ncbi:efflux RND transporter permease subunit [Sphingobacterium sp. E70]|uniref:efflux RND transporter permease subunit n=1 Tax=Sphingobacterium sp. E70 TaxID=2853439 RepID=UPI002795B08F|nr:efflux RND transporter permease subunit [Sphingobacterium sp. E70]
MVNSINDIENITVINERGNPVFVKNVAEVKESSMPRVGQAGFGKSDDVVAGTVVMRKGENPREVLTAVKAKIAELNDKILPKDVKMQTFYDRDNLMDFTTHGHAQFDRGYCTGHPDGIAFHGRLAHDSNRFHRHSPCSVIRISMS